MERIKQFSHEIDVITDGNQKWHGTIPNFSKMAEIMIYDGSVIELFIDRDDDDIRIRLLPSA